MNKRIFRGKAVKFYSWPRFYEFLITNGAEIGINKSYEDSQYLGRVADFNFNGITISYHSYRKIRSLDFPNLEIYATGDSKIIDELEELLINNQKT